MRKKEEGYGSAIKTCVAMGVILMIGVALTLLTGCGEKESSVTTEAPVSEIEETVPELPDMAASAIEEDDVVMTENFSLEAGAGAIGDGAATEVAEADSADVPDDAVLVDNLSDEYGMYQVPDSWTDGHDGAFLIRDNRKYALSKMVPEDVVDRYGVGCRVAANGYTALYLDDEVDHASLEVPTKTSECRIACGDFPVLQLKRNDTVLGYGSCTKLKIKNASFVGYTIEAVRRPGNSHLSYFPLVNHELAIYSVDMGGQSIQNVGLYDTNDNPVEDIHDLNYGQEYLFEYYIGAEYHEMREIANCRCYTIAEDSEVYEIEGELTKNGYVTFDFSNLKPGLYTAGSSIFEIVE